MARVRGRFRAGLREEDQLGSWTRWRRSQFRPLTDDAEVNREFRGVVIAEAQSVVGDQLARVALSVLVYTTTGSALWTAAAYALTFLPDAVAGPALGWIADRYPRKTVMVVCAVIQAVFVALMALPHMPVWALAICISGEAFALSPFMAARSASLPAILGHERYVTAGQAILTTLREAGQMIGLVVAGGIVVALGTSAALLVNAVSYAVTAALLANRLRERPAPMRAARTEDIDQRFRFRADPRRAALVTFSVAAAFTVVPHGVVVPMVAELGAPTWTIGLLLAADPLGFVIGARMLCRPSVPLARQRRYMPWLALVCLGAMVGFAVATTVYLAALLLVLSGWAAAYQPIAKSALMYLLPDEVRGRVVSYVRSGLRTSQGLLVLLGGVVAEQTGTATMAVAVAGLVGAVICLVATLVWHRANSPETTATTT